MLWWSYGPKGTLVNIIKKWFKRSNDADNITLLRFWLWNKIHAIWSQNSQDLHDLVVIIMMMKSIHDLELRVLFIRYPEMYSLINYLVIVIQDHISLYKFLILFQLIYLLVISILKKQIANRLEITFTPMSGWFCSRIRKF